MSKNLWLKRHALYLVLLLVSIFLLLGGAAYLNARWIEYRRKAESQALVHGASIAAALNGEKMAPLFFGEKLADPQELQKFHTRMIEVIKTNSQLRYIALYAVRNGEVHILVDSYMGQERFEIPEILLKQEAEKVFAAQTTLLSPAIEQEQGLSKLVLAPMWNYQTQEIYGILVLALDARELYRGTWSNTIRQFLILFISWLCMLVTVFMFRLYLKSHAMRKAIEDKNQQLLETDMEMQLLVDQMPQALAVHEILFDDEGIAVDYRFLKVNPMFVQVSGFTEDQLLGRRVLEVLPKTESYWINTYAKVALSGEPTIIEHYSIEFDRWFLVHAYSPKIRQFITIFEDITEQRERQKELEFLNFHDTYTRMFNRNAFLLQFAEYDQRLMHPLAIVLFDINGLKDINDTYGFDIGDKIILQLGKCIQGFCSSDLWIPSRLDGDMFGILIPYAKRTEVRQLVHQIQDSCTQKNTHDTSWTISFGYAIKEEQGLGFEAVMKQAEGDLFEHKIAEHATSRQQTIEILLQSLFSKCPREKAHSDRVTDICTLIAQELGLSADQIELIKVAGIMHDIGKIAIDDSVLNKADKLDENEWVQMRRHPEIGFHLLGSVTKYADFAKDVLAHHERWDGKGYPRGLKQTQIPLPSRIIAVADSYDAMTYKRPYRDPMGHQKACEEVKRCSGSQFDPKIVEAFLACSELLSSH